MTASTASATGGIPDPDVCSKEPIHIPGAVEPAGVLLVADEANRQIVQVSANSAQHLAQGPDALLSKTLAQLFDSVSLDRLSRQLSSLLPEHRPKRLLDINLQGTPASFDVTFHRRDRLLYLELERSTVEADQYWMYERVSNAAAELRGSTSVEDVCRRAAHVIRAFSGFDRVMVYRFLQDDSGSVIAEDKRPDLIPYLGLRYPASDIPSQARALYLKNPIRLKPDVNAPPVPMVPELNPVTGKPLDMSECILRRMSPVHDDYLRNMGVAASMSLSIVKGQRLWGLVACHHTTAKWVKQVDRIACELLTDILSSTISSKEDEQAWSDYQQAAEAYASVEQSLRSKRQPLNIVLDNASELNALFRSDGFAVVDGGQIQCVETTPTLDQVQQLVAWLTGYQHEPVLALDSLCAQYPAAATYRARVSGILSIRLTRDRGDFLLFFRPEIVTEVHWAGNPHKALQQTQDGLRLSPRRSFELWKETVVGRSRPWTSVEKQFAASLRAAVGEAQLAEQNRTIHQLNAELSRSNIELDAYAYVAGHDLQEPIRTVRAYAQLLKRTKSDQLDADANELLEFIIQGSGRMHNLVGGLLEYSRVGGVEQKKSEIVSLDDTLNWTLLNLASSLRENQANVSRAPLASVLGDPARLMQVFQNILSNALRYRSSEPPIIDITAEERGGWCTVHIRDNGIGFDPRFSEEIFGLFKRLHAGDVSGTGIGLATSRKIIEQHGGKMWATSEPGKGSMFSFTLPLAGAKD